MNFDFYTLRTDPVYQHDMPFLDELLKASNKDLRASAEEELAQRTLWVNGKPVFEERFATLMPWGSAHGLAQKAPEGGWEPYIRAVQGWGLGEGGDVLSEEATEEQKEAAARHCLSLMPVSAYSCAEKCETLFPGAWTTYALDACAPRFEEGRRLDVLECVGSKRRNDIRNGLKGAPMWVVPQEHHRALILSSLRRIWVDWSYKARGEGYHSAVQQALVWIRLAQTSARINLVASHDRGTLAAFIFDEVMGAWYFHALADCQWDWDGNRRPHYGTSAIYHHLQHVDEPTVLTNAPMSPCEEQSYQLYKRKFALSTVNVYSFFACNFPATKPYIKVPEWSLVE